MEARKKSKKRDAIYNELLISKAHPSAEMLYSSLKVKIPDLSLATVYRNLSMFVNDGDAICVGNVNGHDRYDAVLAPHAHFICTNCGSVEDVYMQDSLSEIYEHIETDTGSKIMGHSLSFSGLCSKCNCKGVH